MSFFNKCWSGRFWNPNFHVSISWPSVPIKDAFLSLHKILFFRAGRAKTGAHLFASMVFYTAKELFQAVLFCFKLLYLISHNFLYFPSNNGDCLHPSSDWKHGRILNTSIHLFANAFFNICIQLTNRCVCVGVFLFFSPFHLKVHILNNLPFLHLHATVVLVQTILN